MSGVRCAKCGAEVEPTDPCCPKCSQRDSGSFTAYEVEPDNDIDGQQGEMPAAGERNWEGTGAGRQIHVRRFGFSRSGFWATLLGCVILVAMLVFALPFVVLFLLIGALWLLIRR